MWTTPWVVYCKPTVQGTEKVLQYLARYVHRVAFANSRLLSLEDGQVTFRYQQRREQQWKTMTLPANEFIRRFLQHVLPRGTHKVRYYGIWNPAHRALLRRVQLATGPLQIPTATEDEGRPPTQGAAARPPGAAAEVPALRPGNLDPGGDPSPPSQGTTMTRDPSPDNSHALPDMLVINGNASPARPHRTSATKWISARLGSTPDGPTPSCQPNVPTQKLRASSRFSTPTSTAAHPGAEPKLQAEPQP